MCVCVCVCVCVIASSVKRAVIPSFIPSTEHNNITLVSNHYIPSRFSMASILLRARLRYVSCLRRDTFSIRPIRLFCR